MVGWLQLSEVMQRFFDWPVTYKRYVTVNLASPHFSLPCIAVMALYEPPSWSKVPDDESNLFRLEVLKSGQIIDVFTLHNKDHFILGRQPDICDFCLEHSSISRKHAVLQYRDDNALMLINFGGG